MCSDNSTTTPAKYTVLGGAGRYNRAPMAGRLYVGGVNQRISSALYKVTASPPGPYFSPASGMLSLGISASQSVLHSACCLPVTTALSATSLAPATHAHATLPVCCLFCRVRQICWPVRTTLSTTTLRLYTTPPYLRVPCAPLTWRSLLGSQQATQQWLTSAR
jgi:hypothetical protein